MPQPQVTSSIYQNRVRVQFSPAKHVYSVTVPGVVEKMWQPSVTSILSTKGKSALTAWAAKRSLAYVEKKLGEYESKLGKPPFSIDTAEIHSFLSEAAESWNEAQEATIGSLAHRFFEAEIQYRGGFGPKPRLPIIYDPVTMPEFTEGMVEMANQSINAGINFLDEHSVVPHLLERVLFSPSTGVIGTTDFIGKVDGELAVLDFKTSKRLYADYRIQLAKYAQMYFEEFNVLPLKRWAVNTKKDGGLEYAVYGVESYQADLNAFEACQILFNFDREHDDYKKGSPVQVLGDLDLLVARPPKTS